MGLQWFIVKNLCFCKMLSCYLILWPGSCSKLSCHLNLIERVGGLKTHSSIKVLCNFGRFNYAELYNFQNGDCEHVRNERSHDTQFLLKNTSEELPFLKNIQLENKKDLMTVDLKIRYTTVRKFWRKSVCLAAR